jgi:hypothetical protein
MSSGFDHMFRRACGGYRLHPKMVPHMWQPGQSGNPSGANGAVRPALRKAAETAAEARKPSPGAERVRRWRRKKRLGVVGVAFDVTPNSINDLIRLGWLPETLRGDKEWIASAIIQLAENAIRFRITPASRVS